MTRRASLALIAGLAVLGWIAVAFGLALTWVADRFFATLLGWA
jgi:type IV secretory pathway TrbD component